MARCRAFRTTSWWRCRVASGRTGSRPCPCRRCRREVAGLIEALGAFQALTAEAAWSGTRRDAVAALAGHPLVLSLTRAEAIYDEMAAAHRAWLPDRLLR